MKSRHPLLNKTILFLSIFLATTCTYAQNQSDIKAVKITDAMKEQLTLSDQQYDQVLEINKEYLKKLNDFRNENEKGSGLREEFLKIKSQWDSELEKVLTDIQFEKYKDNQANRKKKKTSKNR